MWFGGSDVGCFLCVASGKRERVGGFPWLRPCIGDITLVVQKNRMSDKNNILRVSVM